MRPTHVRLFALALALAAGVACSASEPSSQQPLALEELASGWSGGRADPTCRTTGPRGEYLGGTPGAEHCQWPTVVVGEQRSTVTGSRDAITGLGMLMWERTLRDRDAAERFADSLGSAFTRQGLTEYECPDDGRRWQRPDLGVQLTPVPVGTDGQLKVLVVATSRPAALPELLCPGAPKLQRQAPASRTPATAT